MDHHLPVAELSATTRPQDDLWGWVNDTWVASDPIPADRARYGLSDAKRARVAEQLRAVVTGDTDVESGPGAARDSAAARLVAQVHACLRDERARDRAGLAPLDDDLALVATAATPAQVLGVWGALQRTGVAGPFEVYPLPREDDPTRWQVSLFQAGLTLPVPPLYARLGAAVADYAHRLGSVAGLGAAGVDRALRLERALAACSWDQPEGAREEDLVHPLTWAGLDALLGVEAGPWLDAVGVRREAVELNVCQPSYAEGLGALLREVPVEDWQDYLRWRVVEARAPLLTTALDDEHARFHACVVGGQPEPPPRWRRAVEVVQQAAPWALAQAWAESTLTDGARRRTIDLCERLRAQMRVTLRDCAWLGPDSTRAALAKLDAVVTNVGWPDAWPDVPALDDGGPVASYRRCVAHEHDRRLAVLDGPVDRGEWGPPPFVVNTFYQPFLNQVTVEGASLPPTEVLDDLPVLMGQYASIIGHELGHAFDARGATRDHLGRLRAWWTAGERAAFEERVRAVEAQVDGYRPRGVDDLGVDGARVGFECVAELVGVQLAWDAWCAATTPEERAAEVDGLTQAQRFFVAKAYGRRALDRPRTARNRLLGDVHPPFEVFAGLVRNLDGFHEAFATAPGDGMWLAPQDRVRIY